MAYDKRIGERVRVRGVSVEWRPDRKRKRRAAPVQAEVVDVSVAGALLRAPIDKDLGPGCDVVLRYRTDATVARVRSIAPSPDGTAAYGVEFLVVGDDLRALVDELLEAHRPLARERWSTSW